MRGSDQGVVRETISCPFVVWNRSAPPRRLRAAPVHVGGRGRELAYSVRSARTRTPLRSDSDAARAGLGLKCLNGERAAAVAGPGPRAVLTAARRPAAQLPLRLGGGQGPPQAVLGGRPV